MFLAWVTILAMVHCIQKSPILKKPSMLWITQMWVNHPRPYIPIIYHLISNINWGWLQVNFPIFPYKQCIWSVCHDNTVRDSYKLVCITIKKVFIAWFNCFLLQKPKCMLFLKCSISLRSCGPIQFNFNQKESKNRKSRLTHYPCIV